MAVVVEVVVCECAAGCAIRDIDSCVCVVVDRVIGEAVAGTC